LQQQHGVFEVKAQPSTLCEKKKILLRQQKEHIVLPEKKKCL